VLFCYALGKAQRVLAELAALLPAAGWQERPVYLHGAMAAGVDIYRTAGVRMLQTELVAEQGRRGDWQGALVLAPPSAAGSPWLRRFGRASTAFASGWMQLRGNRRRRGHDRGFALSDHADWPSLLRTIRETGATQVLATHGNADALVRMLREDGLDAQALRTEYGGEET
jgi:putative mRNA 3-end processing factor